MSDQQYCLRWNNYQSNMTSVFHQLLQNEAFVDVTLACNDLSLKAHKVVLSACSSYFQKLLLENPCTHPTIIMPSDVCYSDLKFIIEFVYKGEIDVSQAELQSLLKTADQLKIKGLCDSSDEKENGAPSFPFVNKGFPRCRRNLASPKQFKGFDHRKYKHRRIERDTGREDGRDHGHTGREPGGQAGAGTGTGTGFGTGLGNGTGTGTGTASGNGTGTGSGTGQGNGSGTGQGNGSGTGKDSGIPGVTAFGSGEPNAGGESSGGNSIGGQGQLGNGQSGNGGLTGNGGQFPGQASVPGSTGGEAGRDGEIPSERHTDGSDDDDHTVVELQVHCSLGEPDNDMPECLDEDRQRKEVTSLQSKPINMSLLAGQTLFSQFGVDNDDFPPEPPAPSATPVGHVDMQDHSPTRTLLTNTAPIHRTDLSDSHVKSFNEIKKEVDIKFETLRAYDQDSMLEMDTSHMSGPDHSMDSHDEEKGLHTMMITPELMGMMSTPPPPRLDGLCDSGLKSNGHMEHGGRSHGGGPKTWTQEDMELALDALRNHNMSLTKASATYGIPSTTLWQRAHRLGIDTPKKEGPTKSWTEENLNSALEALRTGTISANKASKAYGIPSSTLYKIARREGIRLAAPFNAAPTTWSPEDLEKALESIRSGQTSVQRASTEYGIPTGTLYGRCKREGIELSRSNPTPWSEDAMGEALEAVRLGHMSINQAAIHYNLPYSSLYGRFKRGIKYAEDGLDVNSDSQSHFDAQMSMDYNIHQQNQYQQHQSNS